MRYITILVCLALFSCSDFLKEEVFTSVNPEDFYKNETQVIAAINGAYATFQVPNYYDDQIFQIADLSSDMLDTRWTNNPFAFYKSDKGRREFRNFWEAAWVANNAINAVVEFAPKATMDEEVKKRVIAEAKFLRALNYFNMIRFYGRVPLVLNFVKDIINDGLYPSSNTLEEVYAQIIQDLIDAEQDLPWQYDASNIGRATKGAAMSLLGKVYLTHAGWRMNADGSALVKGDPIYFQKAADKLKEVIEEGSYDLFPDYADNFSNASENGIEHIFSIQFKQGALGPGGWGGEGSTKQTRWAPKYAITHSAYETYRATTSFYASFDNDDLRKKTIFLDNFVSGSGVEESYPGSLSHPFVKKYIRDIREGGDANFSTASASDGEENTIVLRYADVLLMHSEALMEATGTVNEEVLFGINTVRERAGLIKYNTVDFSNIEEFRNAIINERNKELCYEGHGWFDYVRMGILEDKVAKATQKFYYWPIPSLEINKNPNLLQSPGWE